MFHSSFRADLKAVFAIVALLLAMSAPLYATVVAPGGAVQRPTILLPTVLLPTVLLPSGDGQGT